jgi:hypothetical protein
MRTVRGRLVKLAGHVLRQLLRLHSLKAHRKIELHALLHAPGVVRLTRCQLCHCIRQADKAGSVMDLGQLRVHRVQRPVATIVVMR